MAANPANLKEQLRATILEVYKQITSGCGRPVCSNSICACNPELDKITSKEQAMSVSIVLGSKIVSKEKTTPLCSPAPPFFTLEILENIFSEGKRLSNYILARRLIGNVFSSGEALNQSFLKPGIEGIANNTQSGVDGEAAFHGFTLCLQPETSDIFHSSVNRALVNMKQDIRRSRGDFENPENLRQFIVLLHNPIFSDTSYHKSFLIPFCSCIASLPDRAIEILISWLSEWNVEALKNGVTAIQNLLTFRAGEYASPVQMDEGIKAGSEFLSILEKVNKKKGEPLSYTEFYNDIINERISEPEELQQNYLTWRRNRDNGNQKSSKKFTICDYYFMLSPFVKSFMLLFDSKIQQHEQRVANMNFLNPSRGNIVLRVEREHLVGSSLAQVDMYLKRDVTAFKRKLRVKFEGEEGIDEGGVQKEFFQLIVKKLFDEKFGMFVLIPESRCYWMRQLSEDMGEFTLIGIIIGLAIYNGVILDVHFPTVMYKKIMGLPLHFDDVKDLDHCLWTNLGKLLEYTGDDLESVFALDFQIYFECYGSATAYELIENGKNVNVTQSNKHQYVELYTNWLLKESVDKQFEAFLTGFKHVCEGIFFELFRLEEVELLVCGDPELDFEQLESVTVYDGFEEDDEIVTTFWKVLHSLTDEEKKQFLSFTTGSDRSPIGGLKNLRFVLQKHGEDDDKLPQAHTCFNVLLLPPYSSEEKLRERLLLAIQNATGFGLL